MYIYLSCIVVRAEDSELKDLLIKGKPVQSCTNSFVLNSPLICVRRVHHTSVIIIVTFVLSFISALHMSSYV